ncbi:hypothetical protein ACIPYQ_34060 [Streptomyces sp. NPDC090045]|uniref:hypothetical protein n=1 Tax=Streptomyces sp. NPDC090045 TaxID=3365927 RepID=UPI0037F2F086
MRSVAVRGFRLTENVWAYRVGVDYLAGDLTGYGVEALDGSIGKVDKHSDEVTDAYLVVDTGVWILGKEDENLGNANHREALGTHYLSGMPFGVPPA